MNKYEEFVGKVLDGRYRILELVGLGGMACVLKAQDLVMNRIVAIKILNDEYNGNEQAEARFIDESKAVAMLSNKNIVSVYDVAIYPDIKYIVMEYLDGITLREYLDNKGAIGWKEACIYMLQILRALEHAHSKGIIHRDIKPQNVILMKNGDIKVTDFGIAKLPNTVSEQTSEKAIGTVYYISPEQACGKETDAYSDIYSVGIMLYEAVTGILPFTADTPMEVAMMQVNDEPVNPRDIVLDIPVGVSQIILKAMEKSPDDRFQSAHSMAKALEWVLRNPDVIFAMSAMGASESPIGKSVVSIDMIDTSEIEPYAEEEIADSLGKKSAAKSPSGKSKSGEAPAKNKRKKKKKKAKVNRSMFPIICGVAIPFLIVAAMIVVFVLNDLWTANEIKQEEKTNVELKLPDLTSEKTFYSIELENKLKTENKVVIDKIEYVNEINIDNNLIVSTEPEGGASRKRGEDGLWHFSKIVVNQSKLATVPNLIGFSKNQAKEKLSDLELKYEFVTTSDEDFSYCNENQVVNTYPEKNTVVEVGDTITVTIYSREASTQTGKMPNLIGCTKEEATKLAETYAKYKIGNVSYKEVENGNNTVVEQSVAPGTRMSLDNNLVDIVIGLPQTTMVDLTGMTLAEAQEYIDNHALLSVKNVQLRSNFNNNLVGSELDKELIETIGATATNIDSCRADLMNTAGCAIDFSWMGTGTIVFQSIKGDQPLTSGNTAPGEPIYIDVIIVRYESSEPNPDVSGDPSGDNSETSGGESSGVTDPWA